MGTLRMWWQKLTGGETAPARAAARPDRPARPSKPPARSATPEGTEGLTLADEPPLNKRSRVGAAGFDPYSSDAGYSKPHRWERVDHD